MKKRLTIFLALLCMSVMGWATQYCEAVLSDLNAGETAGQTLTFTASKTGELETTFTLTSATSTLTGLYEAVFQIAGGGITSTNWSEWNISAGTLSKVVTWTTYPSSNIQLHLVARRDNSGGGSDIIGKTITDIDVSASCGGGSSKEDPELNLNATTKTLQIDASAETFQIVATKAAGSGAISYESSDNDVATVSNSGLITAIGAGTATITVSVAENEDFDADSKTITVEVIDWPNTGWLANSGNAYKLHISPEISDGFGGKRIEGSNLWVGFPTATFGACSIEYSAQGAGVSFPLTQFTKHINQFTMVCSGTTYTFTVYRLFDGVNLAKNMPSYAGATALPKAEANDGNKDSRWASGGGAKHYPSYGDIAEDWWYVDLGAMYAIDSIRILSEGAAPKNYDLLTSPNGSSWVIIGSYNATPKIGQTDDKYNVYKFSSKIGRYVKIFAREAVQGDFAYGISMWEFEVYGQPVEDYDINNPVLTSATLSGSPTESEVAIAVSATDAEGAVTTYRVVDNTNGVNRNVTVADGRITLTNLKEVTSYHFSVTALDAIGNQSNAIVVDANTLADQTVPQVAAPTPSGTNKEIRPIYSDAFASILAHSFDKDGFAGAVLLEEKSFDGNSCLIYDMSSSNEVTWGMYDNGANAIIAASGYNAEGYMGVDASAMEYMHIDIWSLQACNSINICINDQALTSIRLSHNGGGWQSFDIDLTEFNVDDNEAKRTQNVRWFKFTGLNAITGKMAIDNVYFWKNESNVKTILLSVNNGSWGTATATAEGTPVTDVASGTEVTFTATPENGYDFAYWTVNGSRITANPYLAEIESNTTVVATFEEHRTAYCSTPVTDGAGRTLYLTISKTENANEYKILFEGSADNKLRGDNVYIGTGLRLRNVNGESVVHFGSESGLWHISDADFGSAYITFTATDFRDISFANKGIDFYRNNSAGGSDLSSFNAFPDASLIKWDATCTDEEAPVLAAPVATPLSGTSVRLALSATDNMAALLTYTINYKPAGSDGAGTDVEVAGTAGETTYQNIKGLAAGTRYQFSVTVSDGINESDAQVCYATPSMATAPVPTHNADLVRSVYSDKYESALVHDFQKDSWHGNDLTYVEANIGGDHSLIYDLVPYNQDAWFSWGAVDGANSIEAKDVYTDGANTGLDASGLDYLHIDVWSANAAPYFELQIMDTKLGDIPLTGIGWQSFDLPLAAFKEANAAKISNIHHMKYAGLRGPSNPEEIAIDNVYFWQYGAQSNVDKWSTFAAPVAVKVPNEVTVYTAEYQNNNGDETLTLHDAGKVIPANKGVILEGNDASTSYAFTLATSGEAEEAASNFTSNCLVGCATRTDISDLYATYDIFCMRRSESYNTTGFFLYTGQYIPAGKAYLKLSKNPAAGAPASRRVRFVYDTATAIDNNAEATVVTKFIENGQLFIRRGDAIYTTQGVRVE